MKRTTTKINAKRLAIAALLLASASSLAAAGKKSAPDKVDKRLQAYAIIAGTVFQESGFSLPGAAVTLNLQESSSLRKFKKMEALSDARGEFAFRVPAVAAHYVVKATAKGFRPLEHEVEVSGEQFAEAVRTEVNLVLPPESETKPSASESK